MKNTKIIITLLLAATLLLFAGCKQNDPGRDNIAASTESTVSDADTQAMYHLYDELVAYGESLDMTTGDEGEIVASSGAVGIFYYDGKFYYYNDEAKSEKKYISFEEAEQKYFESACDLIDSVKKDGAVRFTINFDMGNPESEDNLIFIDVNGYK